MSDEPGEPEGDDTSHSAWARSTGHGIAWSTVAFVAARAISFLSLLVLARLVAPDAFGVLAAIITFLGFLELASDLGMRNTVVYEQEHGITPRVQTAFALNLGISFVLTVFAAAASPLVAAWFHVPDEAWLFALASLNLLFAGFGNIYDGVLMRGMDFRRRTGPLLARSAVRALVTIPLAVAGLGAEALVIGYLAGTVAWVAVLWVIAHERIRPRYDAEIARSMLAYGTGASALEVLAAIGTAVPALVIGRTLGSASLGLYTVAQRIPELFIESVAWNVSVVAFPALAQRRATDPDAVSDATNGLIRWTVLFATPVAVWIAVLAGPLIYVLLGPEWTPATGVLSALAISEIFAVAVFPVGDAFKAAGKQRAYIVIQVIAMVVLVGLMVLASPAGLDAVAWARTAQLALFVVAIVFLAQRVLGFHPLGALRAMGPGMAAGVGVFAGAKAVHLALPADALGPLVLGTIAAALGGAASLRVLSPDAWHQSREVLTGLLERVRPTSPQAAS